MEMEMYDVNGTTEATSYDYENEYDDTLIPSAQVQFWTYLILEIPSIFCTIFLLFHLLLDRRLRQQIHNHVVTILLGLCLIILVVDNSLYLDGWRTGQGNSFRSSSGVCLMWWLIDYGFYGAISVFLVWGSFERHLLIFHRRRFFSSKTKTFVAHYLPLIVISFYLIGFYCSAIIFPPCENVFYFDSLACGSNPCYLNIFWLNRWDYLLHGILSNILEALFSSSLLVRTIWRRFYSQRRLNWKKYRKMTIQLLSISAVSLTINLPDSLITLVQNFGPDLSDFGASVQPYLFYFTGYLVLVIPFVCLGCLPELWSKLFFCCPRRRGTVAVMAIGGDTFGPTATIRPK